MPSITEIIRGRRSVFPPVYNDRPIEKQLIEEILENANWAPNHRMTEPWRFRVFTGDSRQKLSDFLGGYYKAHTPAEKFSELKYKKTIKKPLQSACIIAICMQRDPAESLPEWEEIAAVSCAVQNMWLTASAHGIGAYWSSPGAIKETTDLLNLKEGERCLGFFFMGYSDAPLPEGKRSEIGEKVEWM